MMSLLFMFAFMLIPIWIPIVAVTLGYVSDMVRRSPSEAFSMERRRADVAAAVTQVSVTSAAA